MFDFRQPKSATPTYLEFYRFPALKSPILGKIGACGAQLSAILADIGAFGAAHLYETFTHFEIPKRPVK